MEINTFADQLGTGDRPIFDTPLSDENLFCPRLADRQGSHFGIGFCFNQRCDIPGVLTPGFSASSFPGDMQRSIAFKVYCMFIPMGYLSTD